MSDLKLLLSDTEYKDTENEERKINLKQILLLPRGVKVKLLEEFCGNCSIYGTKYSKRISPFEMQLNLTKFRIKVKKSEFRNHSSMRKCYFEIVRFP